MKYKSGIVLALPVFVSLGLSLLLFGCGGSDQADVEEAQLDSMEDMFEETARSEQETITSDTVVALVNGREILFSQVEVQINELLGRYPQDLPREELERQAPEIIASVIQNIITAHLIEEAVERENIVVDEDDVIIRLRQIASQIPDGRRLSEILDESGVSMEDFKDGLRDEMATEQLVDRQLSSIPDSTEDEIRQFYETNKQEFEVPESVEASHVFVAFDQEDEQAERATHLETARQLRRAILDGQASFEEVARNQSDAPSRQDDGKLGTIYRGQMLSNIDQALFSQDVGEIGEPIETSYGYHIIRVDERSEAKTLDLSEAREDIKAHLEEIKHRTALNEYLQELHSAADIEILRDPNTIRINF